MFRKRQEELEKERSFLYWFGASLKYIVYQKTAHDIYDTQQLLIFRWNISFESFFTPGNIVCKVLSGINSQKIPTTVTHPLWED